MGNRKDLTNLPDTSWMDEHFHCCDSDEGSLTGLFCILKCVGRMTSPFGGQGPGLIHLCNPLTWAAASTSLHSFALCSSESESYDLVSSVLSNSLSPCSSQWTDIIISQRGLIIHLDSHLHHPWEKKIVQLWKLIFYDYWAMLLQHSHLLPLQNRNYFSH